MKPPEEVYVIGKDRQWMLGEPLDVMDTRSVTKWSPHVYDAKRYESCYRAKKKAARVGGEVYRFNPLNGDTVQIRKELPPGANCDGCVMRSMFDGTCRNGESEYYREAVSGTDVCEEWEGKA